MIEQLRQTLMQALPNLTRPELAAVLMIGAAIIIGLGLVLIGRVMRVPFISLVGKTVFIGLIGLAAIAITFLPL